MRAEEIMETIDCHTSLEDEVLKLYCLFNCCMSSCKDKDEEFLSRRYVLEKVSRLLRNKPIILDGSGKKMFVQFKQQGSTTP